MSTGPTAGPEPETLTIGHSTRSLEVFVELLRRHGVELLADIRTVPRSRRHPWFDRASLPASLQQAGIGYVHLPALGGLRRPRPDSPNAGWRNESFRGYADYMQRPEFAAGLEALLELAGGRQLSVMCAEAVPWRCHRSLLSDALTVRGVSVRHITGPGPAQPHRITPWAHVDGTTIRYPPEATQLPLQP